MDRRTLGEAVGHAEELLEAAGIPAARLEAEVLLAHHLDIDRSALIGRWADPLDAHVRDIFLKDVDKRAGRYPLQYITGRQEFYSLLFQVDERVLIPRPETEMVVEEVLRTSAEAGSSPFIVDVGTGSGCVAVALAVHLPGARFLATDVSLAALDVARRNAARHGVASRIDFAHGDGLAPATEAGIAGRADYVVSNPPYIAAADLEGLQAELRYEPRIALSPGGDGLEFTARLLRDAGPILRPGGRLLVELSAGRSSEAAAILREGPWREIRVLPDLQGIPRLLTARAREPGSRAEGSSGPAIRGDV